MNICFLVKIAASTGVLLSTAFGNIPVFTYGNIEYLGESETSDPTASPNPSESPEPSATAGDNEYSEENEGENDSNDNKRTTTQRNAINMLNYMTVLTEEINASREDSDKGSRLLLDSLYFGLYDNMNPDAVDSKTQRKIVNMMDTIHQYQMLDEKRKQVKFIYEQNQAQAMRKAIPNPIGLLSAVQSGNALKLAASVIYMAVDSAESYKSASNEAELKYIKDGWDLDAKESDAIHSSRTDAIEYLLEMVRDYNLPGDYALSEKTIKEFVDHKNEENLVSKISWLESDIHKKTYEEFPPYWLVLGESYYDLGEYQLSLNAFAQYEKISSRIFRQDKDYASALPKAIISAKETLPASEYVKYAEKYCPVILNNSDDDNWTLRYFVALIYTDLYSITKNNSYLKSAYTIAFDNVNELVKDQQELNNNYMVQNIEKVIAPDNATKKQKEEVKQTNKLLKENRKTALPPVNEELYLNCDLLFELADTLNISSTEKNKIDAILHYNGANTFLTDALDERFRFNSDGKAFDADTLDISFDGKNLVIPASCVTERSTIAVSISNSLGETEINDWKVKKVERPKKATTCSEFKATFTSKNAKDYKYQVGDKITITVTPVAESPEKTINFNYYVVGKKVLMINTIEFERQ